MVIWDSRVVLKFTTGFFAQLELKVMIEERLTNHRWKERERVSNGTRNTENKLRLTVCQKNFDKLTDDWIDKGTAELTDAVTGFKVVLNWRRKRGKRSGGPSCSSWNHQTEGHTDVCRGLKHRIKLLKSSNFYKPLWTFVLTYDQRTNKYLRNRIISL